MVTTALWWFANAVLFLVVIPVVVIIAQRLVRVALVIRRYADDILEHGVGITAESDGLAWLETTRQRVSALRRLSTEYVGALRGSA